MLSKSSNEEIFAMLNDAESDVAPAKRTSIVWQTYEVLLIMHNIFQFGRHTNICLANFFAGDKQKCFLKV